MKTKILSIILIAALVLTVLPVSGFAAEVISVELDGKYMSLSTSPIMINDRVMLPLRSVFEALGAEVVWRDEWSEVEVNKGSTNIRFRIGDTYANVNGEAKDMYGGSVLINGNTMISTRFAAESLGLYVDWDESRNTVVLQTELRIPDKGNVCPVISATANNDDGNVPENVIDDDYFTRWSSDLYGCELTLELAELSKVRYLGLAFYNGEERQTRFGVAVSTDGNNYTTVIKEMSSHYGLNMAPIDLGAEYDAKYIKIYGYGNTSNEWNSITEIKVYSAQPDGSMPVDENGPGVKIKKTFEDLPGNIQEALNSAETVFDGIIPWLANLYDPETGGFYLTISGRDDPDMKPALEMTAWGITMIRDYTNILNDMPADVREKFIKFYNDRQDPVTGFYIDTQGPTNDRETARNQSTSLSAMSALRTDPIYPHPSKSGQSTASSSSTSETVPLPDYMQSVDSYINWVSSLNWASASWGAGDNVQASQTYVKTLPKDMQIQYVDALIGWLDSHQHQDTGLWADNIDFNSVSGAFKNGLTYSTWGREMPNADKIIDSVVECYKNYEPENGYYIRNPLSVLAQIAGYDEELEAKVQNAVIENIDYITKYFEKFSSPDGAFSNNYRRSMVSFGGVKGSHGLWEGDLDGTLMILIARNALYSIFGVTAPPLKADDFWDWITGKKEMPSPYADETILEENNKMVLYDFEDYDLGYKVNGTEFSVTPTTFAEAKIVADADKKDNKVLFLNYDGSQASGPYIDFANTSPEIQYKKYKKVVAEYDIKATGAGNFYVQYGNSPSFAIASRQAGNQIISHRVATNMTAYGSPLVTMKEAEWYNFKAEYEMNDDGTDATIKFYVDGELVSESSNYYGVHLGDSPVAMNKSVRFLFYKAGSGALYIDNLKIYSE